MHVSDAQLQITERLQKPPIFAVSFFTLAIFLLSTALGSGWLAVVLISPSDQNRIVFIGSFLVSTLLLALGSVQLVRASAFVRMERQQPFRYCLGTAVIIGSLFLSVQTFGLTSLLQQQSTNIATDVKHAAFAFIFLHAVHVIVALLFVAWVYLQSLADRYDHEYSWGVTVCGWFWHGLGVVWIAIMGVFTIAGAAAMSF